MRKNSKPRRSYVYIGKNNLEENCYYVGVTVNPKKRFAVHRRAKENCYLHRSVKKYGESNFTFSVIEDCASESSALEREKSWISKLRELGCKLYNETDGGEGTYGIVPSYENRLNRSLTKRGEKK